MENPIIQYSYGEIRKKGKEYYGKIGRIWSPALNDYVLFNNVGFTHLLRKRGVPRARGEQKRRLLLLPDAVDIITDSAIETNKVHHQTKYSPRPIHQNGKKTTVLAIAHIWKFTRKKGGKNIKVIVRQFEDNSKHFYSAYSKKQKSAQ